MDCGYGEYKLPLLHPHCYRGKPQDCGKLQGYDD
jgi:hypothetical protein